MRNAYCRERRDCLRRWEQAQRFPDARIADSARVAPDCRLAEGVAVGEGVCLAASAVGRYTYFAAHSRFLNVTIGSFCSIGPRVLCGMGRHPSRDFVSSYPAFYALETDPGISFVTRQKFSGSAPIRIGHDVWIGARATITDGVTIHSGAIIAAGATVIRDVPAYAIVAGVPAVVKRYRFNPEEIDFLLTLAWWEKDLDWIRRHADAFESIGRLRVEVQPE